MKELKFRVWIERYKKYMPISLIDFEPISGKIVSVEVIATGGDWAKFYPEEVILEQYTGLKDKNGKEIYEGDIISEQIDAGMTGIDGKYSYVVKWSEYFCSFIVQTIKTPTGEFLRDEIYQLNMSREVIGNIHENPELLEGEG